ncbi:hypothetical protein [Sphingobacterium kyonggiense]
MSKYFLLYKHYNIAWGKINFSFIILPNGNIYYFNSPNNYLDILGFDKDNISIAISQNDLSSAIELGQEYVSKKILDVDINGIKPIQLQEDKSIWKSDCGYELYALFRYNSDTESYEYIPLQVFEKYYSKAPKSQVYQCLVSLIDSYKHLISDKIETKSSSFLKDDLDDETFIGMIIKD